jgi:uncharacterized protein
MSDQLWNQNEYQEWIANGPVSKPLGSPEAQLIQAAISHDLVATQLLLSQGVAVNAISKGSTALMWASAEHCPEIVNCLLAHGADVNLKKESGYTALMYAAEGDYPDILSILLDYGATVNHSNHYGETILMVVARQGQTELVLRLLELGADIRATNKIGDTALYLAAERGHTYTVKALIDRGAEVRHPRQSRWLNECDRPKDGRLPGC